MKIFLPMFLSFFVVAIGIRLADRIFGGKFDEPLALTISLLIAIATGLECSVSVVKKSLGLD
jgi:hypothetical protein